MTQSITIERCWHTQCPENATSYLTGYYMDGSLAMFGYFCEMHSIRRENQKRGQLHLARSFYPGGIRTRNDTILDKPHSEYFWKAE